jgi:hypothetical protein
VNVLHLTALVGLEAQVDSVDANAAVLIQHVKTIRGDADELKSLDDAGEQRWVAWESLRQQMLEVAH